MNNSNINLANLLSFSRIILGLITFLLFLYIKFIPISSLILGISLNIILFIIFITALITDALDGYVARKNNQITDFGKHLDPLADSFFFILTFMSFMVIKLMPWYFFAIILIRELFMHAFLRPYFKAKGKSLPANKFGKIKTLFQSIFSGIILFFLIVERFIGMNIIKIHDAFLISLFYQILNRTAFVFFALISFLSLLSLFTYLITFKKTFSN